MAAAEGGEARRRRRRPRPRSAFDLIRGCPACLYAAPTPKKSRPARAFSRARALARVPLFSNSPARPLRSSATSRACVESSAARSRGRLRARRRFFVTSANDPRPLPSPAPYSGPPAPFPGDDRRRDAFGRFFRVFPRARLRVGGGSRVDDAMRRRRRARSDFSGAAPRRPRAEARPDSKPTLSGFDRLGAGVRREVSLDGSVRGVSRRRFEAVRRVRARDLSNAPVVGVVRPRRGVVDVVAGRGAERVSTGCRSRARPPFRETLAPRRRRRGRVSRRTFGRVDTGEAHGRRRRGLGAGAFFSGRDRTRRARRRAASRGAGDARFASRNRERVGNPRVPGGTVSAVSVA